MYTLAEKYEKFCRIRNSFVSVFNLGNDLIFQTKQEFIKIKDCIDTDKSKECFPFNRTVFVNDTDFRDILQQEFNLSAPVYGFTFQFMSRECGDLDEFNECTEIYDDSSIFYACVYGTDANKSDLKYIAKKYNNSRLQDIHTIGLESRVRTYCQKKYKHEDNNLSKEGFFSGTSFRLAHAEQRQQPNDNSTLYEDKVTYQIFTTESLARPSTVNLLSYQFCKLYDENLTENWDYSFEYYVPKTRVFYVFRYQNLTFGCPQNCDLYSNLSVIKLGPNLTVWDSVSVLLTVTRNLVLKYDSVFKYEILGSNQSFQSLMGCQLLTKPEHTFRPTIFCSQKGIQNVFSLGEDLYFQNNGMFWKYNKNSFTKEGNPHFRQNLSQIRFDSDITQTLQAFNIDTSQQVIGFTFKLFSIDPTLKEKMCLFGVDSKNVRCTLFHSVHYYRACIYGHNISVDSIDKENFYERKSFAFQYTPSGLKEFPKFEENSTTEVADETLKVCKHIHKLVFKDDITIHSMSVFTYEPNFHFEIIQTNTTLNVSELLIFNVNKSNILDEIISFTKFTIESKDISNPFGMFFYPFMMKFYIFDIKRHIFENLLYFENTSSSLVTLKNSSQSFASLFGCPFNQSYSLVSMEKEDICKTNSKLKSIFNIGNIVYFQSGRHFYRYNYIKNSFNFDKYITDLLNDYFDTRHRVTGYSYLYDVNLFRVILMGRTTWRDTSEVIKSTIYRMFDLNKVSFEPLIPLNDRVLREISNTFNSFNKQYLNLGITSDKILGIAFMQTNKTYLDYINEFDPNKDKQINPLVVIYDLNYQRFLNVSTKLSQLEFPANKRSIYEQWFGLETKYFKYQFKDIKGLFFLNMNLYFVAVNGSSLKVFQISSNFDISTTILSYHEFSDFFKCKVDSKSEESLNSDLSLVFVSLLIVLVILAITVGSIAYFSKQSKSEKTEQTEQEIEKISKPKVKEKSDSVVDSSTQINANEEKNMSSNSTKSVESFGQKSESETVRSE